MRRSTTAVISRKGSGVTNFRDTSTAANATITNSGSDTATNFLDTSNAGNAAIQNDSGGTTNFSNSSTAANAEIFNVNLESGAGVTNFRDTSTAANATITNSGPDTSTNFFDTSKAGNATIQNDSAAPLASSTARLRLMRQSSTAILEVVWHDRFFATPLPPANATITNEGADAATVLRKHLDGWQCDDHQHGYGQTVFGDTSSAGTSTITNIGNNGSVTFFRGTSTAENATIINSGTSSQTGFTESATAGTGNNKQSGKWYHLSSTRRGPAMRRSPTLVLQAESFSATPRRPTMRSSSTRVQGALPNSVKARPRRTQPSPIRGDGSTQFFDTASGGNARLINANATAFFDISGLTSGGTTAGSIEGNGTFFLVQRTDRRQQWAEHDLLRRDLRHGESHQREFRHRSR